MTDALKASLEAYNSEIDDALKTARQNGDRTETQRLLGLKMELLNDFSCYLRRLAGALP